MECWFVTAVGLAISGTQTFIATPLTSDTLRTIPPFALTLSLRAHGSRHVLRNDGSLAKFE